MKSAKIIVPIVVIVVIAVIVVVVRKATDHTDEFRDALYSGNLAEVEDLLKAHPSLANASNMEDANRGGGRRLAPSGWTPLHVAADMNNVAMINLLVKYHAKVDAKDKRGLTPLLWTAFGGERDAAAALLSNGADINARGPDGRSTLDLAKLSLDNNLIELLRSRGAKE